MVGLGLEYNHEAGQIDTFYKISWMWSFFYFFSDFHLRIWRRTDKADNGEGKAIHIYKLFKYITVQILKITLQKMTSFCLNRTYFLLNIP